MDPWAALSWVCYLISLVAYLFVVYEAFQEEAWKGAAALVCGIYALYYAVREWEHDLRWLVRLALIGGGVLGRMIPFLAAMQQVGSM